MESKWFRLVWRATIDPKIRNNKIKDLFLVSLNFRTSCITPRSSGA